jgi:hypothetical protein
MPMTDTTDVESPAKLRFKAKKKRVVESEDEEDVPPSTNGRTDGHDAKGKSAKG